MLVTLFSRDDVTVVYDTISDVDGNAGVHLTIFKGEQTLALSPEDARSVGGILLEASAIVRHSIYGESSNIGD